MEVNVKYESNTLLLCYCDDFLLLALLLAGLMIHMLQVNSRKTKINVKYQYISDEGYLTVRLYLSGLTDFVIGVTPCRLTNSRVAR